MKATTYLLFAALIVCAAPAWCQPNSGEPHIGYLYPGGGQQGSTFLVTVGGQALRNPGQVFVSGDGVEAKVIRYVGRMRPPQKDQRDELARRMKAARDRRLAEEAGEPVPIADPAPEEGSATDTKPKGATLPNHPMLHNLDNMTLRELEHVKHELQTFRKAQRNAQLAESVIIEVTVASDAAPGMRELRMIAAGGLTNPMFFHIGQAPETREYEPNGPKERTVLRAAPPLDLPVVMNGQIMPGDVDRFRFRADKGQKLVVNAQARSLIPYMADAVPGWFQATVALFDAKGKEVAFADDYQFSPDPAFYYEVPKDGVYMIEVRDAIYRGRDDFVYRIAVGEFPFVTQTFPLGAQAGQKAAVKVSGWNLPATRLRLDTEPEGADVRQAVVKKGGAVSNPVRYAIDDLPECTEMEPNSTLSGPHEVEVPIIVNGQISKPGDMDVFRFEGNKGDTLIVEVAARTLNSPLDSVVHLMSKSGDVIEWNDDHMEKDGHLHTGPGLVTHHADSFLCAELPKNGAYLVQVSDSQRHGGEAYAYRLRLSAPRPDFAIRVAPSSINVAAGRSALVWVHALRKDGFDGEIEVTMKDGPAGYTLDGGRIPAGQDCVRMTLSASPKVSKKPATLHLEGVGFVDGESVVRPALACDDTMQAFLWRHLVPAEQLVAAVKRTRKSPPVRLASSDPVRLTKGGSAEVRVKTPASAILKDVRLELSEPPEGVTLSDVKVIPEGGLAFMLEASKDAPEGFADNLIVQAFVEPSEEAKASGRPVQRTNAGVLPAIPFEIVP
ncbi:MAG: hypothetical protein GY851_21030 [bacterium]|nr:hypothetical protein [bacterium]